MSLTHVTAVQRLSDATPATRERYVDFLRVASIAVVVVAHWILALVVLDGTTALGRSRTGQLLTWALMVMPVFFAVGGFSDAKALGSLSRGGRDGYRGFVHARATRLLRPVVALAGVWLATAVVLDVTGLGRGSVELALDRSLTPLWFVAVYLLVAVLAPPMHALHRRWGGWGVLALVAAVAVLDVLRYADLGLAGRGGAGLGWAGSVNLVLVWLTVHQLGYLWADGVLTRRGVPLALAAGGIGTAVVLTLVTGWYPVDMQGLPGSPASNFAPPNLALLAHGFGMVGVVLAVRRPVAEVLSRPRVWAAVVAVGSVTMTVFCWHLTAVFAVQGVLLAGGVVMPAAGSPAWWLVLPVWLAACAVPLAVLVSAFRGFERPVAGGAGAPLVSVPQLVAGVVLTAVGVFVVSQVGLDRMTTGAVEPVMGVPVPLWLGVALWAGGSWLAGLRGRGDRLRATAAEEE